MNFLLPLTPSMCTIQVYSSSFMSLLWVTIFLLPALTVFLKLTLVVITNRAGSSNLNVAVLITLQIWKRKRLKYS